MKTTVKIPDYTRGEEIFNAVSHIAGGGLCIIGTAILLIVAAAKTNAVVFISCAIYGATMILLYTMSSLYHMFKYGKAKRFFRIMDHNSIFLLIAGTYTPYSLIALRGTVGWLLFGAVWFLGIIGIILNSISLEKFKRLSMVCYICMGWAIIFTIKPLIDSISILEFAFLFAGGLIYTGGIFFYSIKKRYFHSVWHLFVLLGTIAQYISVFHIVLSL